MAVKVLGPLDTGTAPLSPRERAILTALIVKQGSSMAPSELAEAYWGESAPPTWAQQIRTSVARIRNRLGKDAVTTTGSDYSLGIEPDVIDAVRFERLVSSARQHSLHGEHDRAVDVYRRALGLWRGAAYPDLADWEPGIVEAMRLDEIRHSAEDELLESRLHTGDHRAVIPEAERLVRESPLREERWAILALANYQAGRQADALAVLRAARERLLDELGIEPGARLTQLETAILRQDPAISPAASTTRISPDCPYRGLAAFGPDDAQEFFGREAEIEEILARVLPGAITTIAGPSGSGKSSLMLAGLIPRLVERGRHVETLRPGPESTAMLRHLADTMGAEVLAVDQGEELLRTGELDAFCAAAARFVSHGGSLILTIRSDFLDDAVSLPEIGTAIGRGVYLLGPLSRSAMQDAIVEPARRAGLRLEPGLVELLLRDASGRPATLPPLSHALQETWVRREGGTLTVDGYEASGGIAGAIAQSAEDLYQSLDEHGRSLYRSTMLRLIERGEDGASVSRRAKVAPLIGDPQRRAIIEALVGSRLAVIDGDTLSVAHEAVATAWPRLDGWLEEDADGARLARHLEAAAQSWVASGRSDDDLLRGARLHAALQWHDTAQPDLTADEEAILQASIEHEQGDLQELASRATRDRANNRRLRWALGGVAGLLVVALISGGVAVGTARQASASAQDAQIEALTERAIELRATNRDIAALIAAEAYRRWPDDARVHAALMSSMTEASGYIGSVAVPDATWRVGAWPIPGTTDAVIVREQSTVDVMDYRTGEIVRSFDMKLNTPNQTIRPWVRVSADASTAVIVQHFRQFPTDARPEVSEEVTFLDLGTGDVAMGPLRVPDTVSETVSLSPDGRYATWATFGDLIVLDRDTGEVRTRPGSVKAAVPDPAVAVSAFAPDGLLYLSEGDGLLHILDPATFSTVRTVRIPAGLAVDGLEVTSDGTTLSTGPEGILAAAPDGTVLWQRSPQWEAECSRIAASSEADLAICADQGGTIQRWRLSTGERVAPLLDLHYAAAEPAFTDGGREALVLGAIAPSIGRLRLDGSGPAATTFADSMAASWSAGLSPSGRLLIVEPQEQLKLDLGGQRSYAIWDVHDDRPVLRIPEDIKGDYAGELWEPHWLGDHRIAIFGVESRTDETGEQTESVTPLTIDLDSGRISANELPSGIQFIFPSSQPDRVYVGWEDGTLRALDIDAMELDAAVFHVPVPPFAVADNPDGSRMVAMFNDNDADPLESYLFDGATGEVLATGLREQHALAMTPSGDVIAGDNLGVAMFSGADFSLIKPIPNLSGVGWLRIDAAGDTLLAQRNGETGIGIIDVASSRSLGDGLPVQGPGDTWLARDGSAAYIPGIRGMVRWTLDPADHFAAACVLAGRDLTDAEWSTYLGVLGDRVATCADVLGAAASAATSPAG